MKEFWKKIYCSITYYDPIIEELKLVEKSDDFPHYVKCYVASPIQPNRKQRREFCFEADTSENLDNNRVRVLVGK